MMNDMLHVLGAALMFFAAVVWFAGSSAVKRKHLRRMGEETLLFDPSQWSTKDFNGQERRAKLLYWLLSCLLASIGVTLINHAWS